jgi:hypothetical protein
MLVAPLLLAVALTFLVAPASAQFGYSLYAEGKGFGRLGRFQYVKGDAILEYVILLDPPILFPVALDFGVLLVDDCEGVWVPDLDTVKEYENFITFRAEYTDAWGALDNELCCGNIRVITFVGGEIEAEVYKSYTILYGWGAFFIGHGELTYQPVT